MLNKLKVRVDGSANCNFDQVCEENQLGRVTFVATKVTKKAGCMYFLTLLKIYNPKRNITCLAGSNRFSFLRIISITSLKFIRPILVIIYVNIDVETNSISYFFMLSLSKHLANCEIR